SGCCGCCATPRSWRSSARPPRSGSNGSFAGRRQSAACTRSTTRSSMSSAEPARVRCPDCGKAVGRLVGELACAGCGRRFVAEGGVWDLLPTVREPVKVNEDLAHVDAGLPTWRRLFMHKRYWLEWCDTDWLPTIVDGSTRSFLEIGGGLCYASALAKGKAPGAYVTATDVSPRYLRHHAVTVGHVLGAAADAYVAADAEALPFEDGQFDAIYSQVV